MTTTLTVDVETEIDVVSETPHSEAKAAVGDDKTVASARSDQRVAGLPFSISRRHEYYWTRRWQDDERASVEELMNGEGLEFPNAAEAIRWLLSDGDDD